MLSTKNANVMGKEMGGERLTKNAEVGGERRAEGGVGEKWSAGRKESMWGGGD